MMAALWHWLWVMGLCLAAASAVRAAPTTEEDGVADAAVAAMWNADFAELERQHTLYQQPGQRTAAGRSKLVLFREGVARVLDGPKAAPEAYFSEMEALTLHWVQRHPGSALAPVLHAQALQARAWWHRGSGFSGKVSPDAWEPFQRHIRRALEFLSARESTALATSSGYTLLLELARASSAPQESLRALALAGLKLNLDDEGLYRAWLVAVLPKWGGSQVQVDRVINEVVRLTAPLHGEIFYARMYAWAGDWEFGTRVYADTGAEWLRVREGYRQLVKRHPAPSNVNGFAYQACLARDKATLLDQLDQIGAQPELGVWGDNARATFENCRRWAAQQ